MTTTESALDVLLDGDIDRVMANLDRIVEAAPSYGKLISRWENQGWNSESFDFTVDAEQWNDASLFSDEQRRFMLFSLSEFFLGEERVTTELLPFAIAAPTDDQRIFLASQIADEARHCVFFDRFYREVIGSDTQTIADNLDVQRANVNDDFKRLFDGILHDVAEELRRDPSNFEALVRGITVYMIVIEGTLALTGARFILRSLKQMDRLPGFRDGFTHVNRDESRHVGFGVKFLADAIKQDERMKEVVQETLSDTLPVGVLAFSPPWVEDRFNFQTPFGYHSSELFEYAMKSLSKKLAAMGMEPAAAGAPV
ncbi:MAG TPA: ribonucleotide-diphosphate reductase subunit beta [Solirubrobacterales bacterium]|nr:ribonucleotide-diphosphate reductase subunit beta [Solirubrobacterales bacterium]